MKELKLATERDIHRIKCPLKLWDDCMESQSYIRSFTAHDIYSLHGEVFEILVSGETPHISEFDSFQWYAWVTFRDQQVSFTRDNFVLGRYLGPSFDIISAMTANILKKNGEYVHSSTYRSLANDKLSDPLEIK